MFKNIKNSSGFTIVETLIVLAIAAIIIIIVLLAVPALQRSQRNTDIKTDASTVGAEVSEYESDNGGGLPTTIANAGATLTVSGATGTTPVTATVASSDAIGLLSGTTAPSYSATAALTAGKGTSVGPGVVLAALKYDCAASGTLTGDSRGVAVFYPIENGGAGAVGCIQS